MITDTCEKLDVEHQSQLETFDNTQTCDHHVDASISTIKIMERYIWQMNMSTYIPLNVRDSKNVMVYLVDEYIHIHPFSNQQYNPDDKELSFSIINLWPELCTDIQHSL